MMRKEPFTVGSYVHIVKRGARGTSIVRDDIDRWRFVLMLRHFNDGYQPENWFRSLIDEKLANTLSRPKSWPAQKKTVEILCYRLMDNHFHLLLKEITDGGVSKFMHRLGSSMSNHFNEKYKEKGSLFQGAYKSRTIDSDNYLRYVSAYIQVKNSFELFPGGISGATKDFSSAYTLAAKDPYCSLGDYAGMRVSPVIGKDLLGEIFKTPKDYESFARDFIEGRNIEVPEEGQRSVFIE